MWPIKPNFVCLSVRSLSFCSLKSISQMDRQHRAFLTYFQLFWNRLETSLFWHLAVKVLINIKRCSFFQHQCQLDICDSLRQLLSRMRGNQLPVSAKNFGMKKLLIKYGWNWQSYQSSLHSFYVLTIWVCNFLAKGFWR